MARSTKNKTVPSYVNLENLRLIAGITLFFFAVYLFIICVSFLFHGKVDQSELGQDLFVINPEIRVDNYGSKTGALLANLFVNKWVGIPFFGIIFLLFVYSFHLLYYRWLPLFKTTLIVVSGVLLSSLILSFVLHSSASDSPIFWGGLHGYYVTTWLNATVGYVGTFFFLLVSTLAFLLVTVKERLLELVNKVKKVKLPKEKVDSLTNIRRGEKSVFLEEEEQEDKGDDEFILTRGEDTLPNQEKGEKAELSVIVAETETTDVSEEEALGIEVEIEQPQEDESVKKIVDTPTEDYDPTLDLSHYKKPEIELLAEYISDNTKVTPEELEENKNRIVDTLSHYKIEITRIKATIGPTITLYEIVPVPGVRISKIKNLEDDIALSLAALGIRIIAPIPGKGTIGIEVPNKKPEIVSMKGVVLSKKFQETDYELPVVVGRTIANESFTFDLTKMPHLLVAGATGQGKSVGLNAIITSLLYKKHPAQLKFVMIDPKMVEFSIYAKIEKHFLAKLPDEKEAIITDVNKVVATLQSLCIEMDSRYDLLKIAHARNIKEYNRKFIKRRLNPHNGHKFLPYIVVIIDEFADLIMTAGKEVEMPIARIAQKARAVGIHMIIATQRPSTNIITGVIKANFPARIAFKVASMIDSRTILDAPGANQLIGRGDMLFSQGSLMTRIQCAFVDTPEVEKIVDFISEQQGYPTVFELPEYVEENKNDIEGTATLSQRDALFEEAARLVVSTQMGSTSGLQRRFSIGYNRAGKIIDQLEYAGIVGPYEGSKARQVFVHDEMALNELLRNLDLKES